MNNLHQMRTDNETVGTRIPSESKFTTYRASWLRDRFYHDAIPAAYFHAEYRQFPESIKKEVEASVFATR